MKQECPWCHVAKANLWEHAQTCRDRPEGATLPPGRPGRRPATPAAGTPPDRAPTRARRPRAATARAAPAPRSNGHGDGWPWTAPAAEQALFCQLVRDGLSLEAARERVAQARQVFRG